MSHDIYPLQRTVEAWGSLVEHYLSTTAKAALKSTSGFTGFILDRSSSCHLCFWRCSRVLPLKWVIGGCGVNAEGQEGWRGLLVWRVSLILLECEVCVGKWEGWWLQHGSGWTTGEVMARSCLTAWVWLKYYFIFGTSETASCWHLTHSLASLLWCATLRPGCCGLRAGR